MADDDQTESPADLVGQLHDAVGRLGAAAGHIPGVSALVSHAPELPHIPLPGALTAAEVEAVVAGIRAQRSSIAATRANLDAFEQQLVVLEQLLEPLQTVTRQWAQIERGVTGGRAEDG